MTKARLSSRNRYLVVVCACLVFIFLWTPLSFGSDNNSFEIKIDEENIFPISLEQDIPKEYQSPVAPISCVAVVLLSYYKLLPIKAVSTKKGIHPFSTYLISTYSLPSGETFTNGAQGAFHSGDVFLHHYLEKQGLIVEQQHSTLSEVELKNTVTPFLMNQQPVVLQMDANQVYAVVGLVQDTQSQRFLVYTPLKDTIQEISIDQFAQKPIDFLFVYPPETDKKTLIEEVYLLVRKRLQNILDDWKWSLEIWFYKQLNTFLKGFNTTFPMFSS
ncbi:MAG TPA: hypothetical protein PLV00_03645 [Caldisericia bacterium]|nr:hypothetical protein [Caldisericia bacterium]